MFRKRLSTLVRACRSASCACCTDTRTYSTTARSYNARYGRKRLRCNQQAKQRRYRIVSALHSRARSGYVIWWGATAAA